jgi:hypothetical protein
MCESPAVWKMVGYAFASAIAASLLVLLVGMALFGFQLSQWAEWEGRLVGVVGTVAGNAGAAGGLWLARRAQRQAVKN